MHEPDINGLTEKEPVWCLTKEINFFLFLIIETNSENCLSQLTGLMAGIVLCFFLKPFE